MKTPKVPESLKHIPKVNINPKSLWEEFKNFAFKGNLVDLAVAVVIGAAFSAVVKSLVDNIVMPGIGAIAGNLDFSQLQWIVRKEVLGADGKTVIHPAVIIYYGKFLGDVLHFLIVAATIFVVMVKFLSALMKKTLLVAPPADPTVKPCPMCMMDIPIKAKKCGHCTSDLPEPTPAPAAA